MGSRKMTPNLWGIPGLGWLTLGLPPGRVRFRNKGVVGVEQNRGVFRRIRGVLSPFGWDRRPDTTHPEPGRANL